MTSNDIELPRKGYETRDVEAMARALAAAEGGGGRKGLVLLVLLAAIVAAVWLLVTR